MKTMNLIKKIVASTLALVVIVAGIVITPVKDVMAATTGADVPTGVVYETRTVADGTPKKDGYLFGGWYKSENDGDFYSSKPTGSTALAKFVPAYILSVKAQNYVKTAWTDATNKINSAVASNLTTTRLVTSVDSSDYQTVGFKIIKQGESAVKDVTVSKVYNYLSVVENDKKFTGEKLFGAGARHCAVLELNKIPETAWNQYTYVCPYWVTPDGTEVTGLPKYVRVDDGLDGYITVAVNLKTAEPVAAGVVNVDYNESVLAFNEHYAGKVFQEMEVADKGTSVKCVGNVENIAENKNANDMYIGLRFQIIDENFELGVSEKLNFAMSEVDFANINEELVDTINVWDVQY